MHPLLSHIPKPPPDLGPPTLVAKRGDPEDPVKEGLIRKRRRRWTLSEARRCLILRIHLPKIDDDPPILQGRAIAFKSPGILEDIDLLLRIMTQDLLDIVVGDANAFPRGKMDFI